MKGIVTIELNIDAYDKEDAEASALQLFSRYVYYNLKPKNKYQIAAREIEDFLSRKAKIEFSVR